MKISFYDWCINNKRQDFLNSWDYTLNTISPDEVSAYDINEYYFKCPCGKHKSSLWKLHYISSRNKVRNICRYCDSFAQHLIEQFGENALDIYWDYNKNNCNPWEISYGCKTVIYINCQNNTSHGSYDILPSQFLSRHIRCPYCSRKRIFPGESFADYYKKIYGEDFLDKYWDYEKNIFDPYDILPATNKGYIYLKCSENCEHGSYKIMPNNFKHNGLSCPRCYQERKDSCLQILTSKYLVETYNINVMHEFDCSIVGKNPKTHKALPYDNEIIINNIKLLIEVHGEQHFVFNCGWNRKEAKRRNITPEQVLKDQQWRDEYKKQYALSQGYAYLAIPYWTEKDESYKKLIDDKILSLTQQNN